MQFFVLLGIAVLAAAALYLLSRRGSRCPSCGRAIVPGRDRCPFCSTIYTTKSPVLSSESPSLVCIQGPNKGREYPITGAEFTIGRGQENSLVEAAQLVSRRHALITAEDGRFVLYDRDSTNGTWVNGRRIAHHILRPEDQIQIGPSVYVFRIAEAARAPAVAPTPEPVRVPTPIPPERRHDLQDYQLVETLGGGGSAKVYRAISRRDNTTVAIKILYQTDPYLVEKFEQAGRILMGLQHPHIVRVHDCGRQDGQYYIIMEYVEDGSLRHRLSPGRPLRLDQAIDVTGQTCEALGYIHSQGVIHRDIKPENILFSSREGVKVADFGIAKWASAPKRTTNGIILGTPYYMSYEQAKGEQVHPQSDIYSLGVVLYEMLTGRVPFLGDALTVVHRHLTEDPMPPRQLNPSIPTHVERAILQALAKDYRQRFSRADEMAGALGYARRAAAPPRRAKPALQRPVARRIGRAKPIRPAVGAQARLLVVQTGRVIPLPGDIVLGRNMVDPSDGLMSRQHARVFQQGQQFWLMDWPSTNGTYLNGQRIFDRALLQNGDEIRLGRNVLRFESTP